MTGFTTADYREIGQTGIHVSPLGLGTVKLGRNTDVKYPAAFELPSDEAAGVLLGRALELGINLLDTAPAYGTAEARLGTLINRGDWIISTKVGEHYENGVSTFDFSREATRASVHRSLQRLRTDYLDIVLVHSDGNDEAVIGQTDVLETLQRMQTEGKLRAFGISTKTVSGGLLGAEVSDVVMVAYSAADESQRPVLDRAFELGKGVLVKKGLASGHAKDPAAALQFALAGPAVSSAVIGTINPAHLDANVSAAKAV